MVHYLSPVEPFVSQMDAPADIDGDGLTDGVADPVTTDMSHDGARLCAHESIITWQGPTEFVTPGRWDRASLPVAKVRRPSGLWYCTGAAPGNFHAQACDRQNDAAFDCWAVLPLPPVAAAEPEPDYAFTVTFPDPCGLDSVLCEGEPGWTPPPGE